jgi:hypothetical protein
MIVFQLVNDDPVRRCGSRLSPATEALLQIIPAGFSIDASG